MKTEKIIVDNLKCGGCANSIKKAINKIIGVLKVNVVEDCNAVFIEHVGQISRNVFIEALANLGYPEEETSTTFQKAKSYVSCAVGKMG